MHAHAVYSQTPAQVVNMSASSAGVLEKTTGGFFRSSGENENENGSECPNESMRFDVVRQPCKAVPNGIATDRGDY
jgi:hypothetical protein